MKESPALCTHTGPLLCYLPHTSLMFLGWTIGRRNEAVTDLDPDTTPDFGPLEPCGVKLPSQLSIYQWSHQSSSQQLYPSTHFERRDPAPWRFHQKKTTASRTKLSFRLDGSCSLKSNLT